MTETTQRRWLLPALLLSVAINIAFVGYLVGRQSAPVLAGPVGNPLVVSGAVGRFVRDLPPERREELKPLVREHLRALRKGARGLRSAHHELQHALRVEPFDEEKTRMALGQLSRAIDPQASRQAEDTYVSLLRAMTPEERRAFAERRRPHHRLHRPTR